VENGEADRDVLLFSRPPGESNEGVAVSFWLELLRGSCWRGEKARAEGQPGDEGCFLCRAGVNCAVMRRGLAAEAGI